MNKLTNKQEAFVNEYCSNGFNAVKAMIKAGYSENYAKHRTKELLSNVVVKEAIENRKAELSRKAEYTALIWLQQTREARQRAFDAENWSAVASFDRLLGQFVGAFEADNTQKQQRLQIAIKNEQVRIDELIELARALENAPDSMAV